VLSFSDLQADIVAALIRQGVAVQAFNQRTIAEIFDMIRLLGALVDAADQADGLADELEAGIADARRRAMQRSRRPLAYFEEWAEPMISGIAWVSELIEAAGGTDIFAERSAGKSAKGRMVTAEEIIARQPDVIIHRFMVRQEISLREGRDATRLRTAAGRSRGQPADRLSGCARLYVSWTCSNGTADFSLLMLLISIPASASYG
jgi:ABC-type hemin transport system substrate-binding protein